VLRLAAGAAGALAVALGLLWLAFVAPLVPRNLRTWVSEHNRLARADFIGDSLVTVRDIRDLTYTSATTFREGYLSGTYDLRRLSSVWFVLTPFSATWRGPAHAFVSFGFDDGRYLAVSVESRREVGETYALIAGALRQFELAYIVATERDLIGRRALFDGDDVFVYPIVAAPERRRQMLVEMLQRANAVQDQPEFYNTLTNNCTSNIVAHVNRLVPGRIPPSYRTVLPGYADELARSLGLIDAGGSMEDLRRRFRVNARAREALASADFSAAIRGLPIGEPMTQRDPPVQR